MRTYTIPTLAALIDLISAGPFPEQSGPVIARATLWNGKVVQGEYCSLKDGEQADIFYPKMSIIMDDELVRPHAERLAENGDSITVDAGKGDSVWTMRWSIAA